MKEPLSLAMPVILQAMEPNRPILIPPATRVIPDETARLMRSYMRDILVRLREPSPEMIKAGADQMPPPPVTALNVSLPEEYNRSLRAAPSVWRAMIDVLLKELGE